MPSGTCHCFIVSCLLVFILLPAKNVADETNGAPSKVVCVAEQDSSSCLSPKVDGSSNDVPKESKFLHGKKREEKFVNHNPTEPDSLFHRSVQDLEFVLDKMMSSKDQMMNDMIDKMSESRIKMVKAVDSMMDKMSESRTTIMTGLDSMMQKVVRSKEQMKKGFDDVLDQVAHSRMMEEIDQLIESISHSQVLQELRSLPQEIRESFILSARNKSYIAAGVMVSIAAAILFSGAIYYSWCHHDAWSYYIGTIEEAKHLLRQAKEQSSFAKRSRSSSEDGGDNNETESSANSPVTAASSSSLASDVTSAESLDDESDTTALLSYSNSNSEMLSVSEMNYESMRSSEPSESYESCREQELTIKGTDDDLQSSGGVGDRPVVSRNGVNNKAYQRAETQEAKEEEEGDVFLGPKKDM